MTKRVCLGIQGRWDNEKKFNLVLLRDDAYTEAEKLWAVYVFAKNNQGVPPETWQTFVRNQDEGFQDLVYVPSENVVEYESSEYALADDNMYPRMVLEAYNLRKMEMKKAARLIERFVSAQMAEKYGDISDYLPEPFQVWEEENERVWSLWTMMLRLK